MDHVDPSMDSYRNEIFGPVAPIVVVESTEQAIAQANPDLATIVDLGPSWQTAQGQANRHVWALRITHGTGTKPKALFTAGHHSRELAPPEVAIQALAEAAQDMAAA